MKYEFVPTNVCSKKFIIDVEDGIINEVEIVGGCPGNTFALCNMLKGMRVEEVVKKLKGIPCRDKGTSCPDQLSKALEKIISSK